MHGKAANQSADQISGGERFPGRNPTQQKLFLIDQSVRQTGMSIRSNISKVQLAQNAATTHRTRQRKYRRSEAGSGQQPPDAAEKEAFLREHFPNVTWTTKRLDFDSEFLFPGWLTAGSFYAAYHRNRELERLRRIEKLLEELWAEVIRMPSTTARPNDDSQMRLVALIYDLTGFAPGSFTGGKDSTVFPAKQGYLEFRRLEIMASFALHPKQAELPAKAQLVDHARELWKRRRKRTPPQSSSPGSPFFEMVGDLIVLARRDWGVENTLRAWRTLNSD